MRLVVIESPFAPVQDAPPHIQAQQLVQNLSYVRAAMADCFSRGEAPFASHALYTQDGVLDDDEPAERRLGMRAGFHWGDLADARVVYGDLGVTAGMKAGIARAESKAQVLEFRSIPAWVKAQKILHRY